jgi:uncharacterized lipoprotein YehR (DUF1307 family)
VASDIISVTVGDGELSDSITLNVFINPVNDAPVIASVPDLIPTEDIAYVFDAAPYLYDQDHQTSALTVTTSSVYCTVVGTSLTLTYPDGIISENVRISVTDGEFTDYQDITVSVQAENDAPVLLAIPDVYLAEDEVYELDVSSYLSDEDNSLLDLLLSENSSYVSVSGHVLTFTYPNGVSSDIIGITVGDGELSDSITLNVFISPVNDAPVIAGVPDLIPTEDIAYVVDAGPYLFDQDNQTSDLLITTSSVYCTVVGTSLTFTYPNGITAENVRISVTDGKYTDYQDISVSVQAVNDAPVLLAIPDVYLSEDEVYELDVSSYLSDEDTALGDLLLSENSSYVSISGHVLTFTYPNGLSSDIIGITVSDGELSDAITLIVYISPVNDAPVISGVPDLIPTEDIAYVVDVAPYLSDADNLTSELTVTTSSAYCSIAGTSLSFTYPNGVVTENVRISVTDGEFTAYQDINVNVISVNDGPSISALPDIYLSEDEVYEFDISSYISDVDNSLLDLIVTENSSNCVVDGYVLCLSYSEGITFDAVNVTVSDGELRSSRTLVVYITPVNDAPVLTPFPEIVINEGQQYVFNLMPYVSDVDNTLAELIILASSSYCAVSGLELIFNYPEGVGAEQVQVSVSDGEYTRFSMLGITINPVNDGPSLSTLPDQYLKEDIVYTMDLSSYITDSDTPLSNMLIIENSSYITVDGTALTFQYPEGVTYDIVEVRVSDGLFAVLSTITVYVAPVNDAPVISGVPDLFPTEALPYVLDVDPYLFDTDNLISDLVITTSSAYCSIVGTSLTFTYPNGIVTENVRISVTDGEFTAYQDISVSAISVNDGPSISALPDIYLGEDEVYEFDISSYLSDVDNSVLDLIVTENSSYVTVSGHVLTFTYPNDVTHEIVQITVTDGEHVTSGLLYVYITGMNDAPSMSQLPDISVTQGVAYVFNLLPYISDIDNSINELTVSTSSNYCSVSGTEITLLYTGNATNDKIQISVTDGEFSSHALMAVTIVHMNRAPVIVTLPILHLREDEDHDFDLLPYVSDSNTPMNELLLSENSSYASLNGYVLQLCYPNGVTRDTIQITVSDGEYVMNSLLEVHVTAINDPPTLSDLPDLTLIKGVPYVLDVAPYISDIDSPTSELTATASVNYYTVNGTELTFLYTSTTLSNQIKIYISDGEFVESQYVAVTVKHPPTISNLPDVIINEGEVYTLDISYYLSDADDDVSKATLSSDSSYCTIFGTILTFNYPTGIYQDVVSIKVSDEVSSNVDTIQVTILQINHMPTIKYSHATIDEQTPDGYNTFLVCYMDEDNDAPTIVNVVIDNVAHTMKGAEQEDLDHTDGKIYRLDIELDAGSHTIKYLIADGSHESVVSGTDYLNIEGEADEKLQPQNEWLFYIIIIILAAFVGLLLLYTAFKRPRHPRPRDVYYPENIDVDVAKATVATEPERRVATPTPEPKTNRPAVRKLKPTPLANGKQFQLEPQIWNSILEAIKVMPGINEEQISSMTGISESDVLLYISKQVERGYVGIDENQNYYRMK